MISCHFESCFHVTLNGSRAWLLRVCDALLQRADIARRPLLSPAHARPPCARRPPASLSCVPPAWASLPQQATLPTSAALRPVSAPPSAAPRAPQCVCKTMGQGVASVARKLNVYDPRPPAAATAGTPTATRARHAHVTQCRCVALSRRQKARAPGGGTHQAKTSVVSSSALRRVPVNAQRVLILSSP